MWRWPSVLRLFTAPLSLLIGAASSWDLSGTILEPLPDSAFYVGGAIFTLVAVAGIEWFTVFRPARRLSHARGDVLRAVTEELRETIASSLQVTVRMNVMVPHRRLRWLLLRRFHHVLWHVGMENKPDVNVQFPMKRGVVGRCFQTGRPVFAAEEALSGGEYKLPRRIQEKVKSVTAVLSYPIYEPSKRTGRQNGRVVGVLTLDSEQHGAFDLLTETKAFEFVDKKMQLIAATAGHFIF